MALPPGGVCILAFTIIGTWDRIGASIPYGYLRATGPSWTGGGMHDQPEDHGRVDGRDDEGGPAVHAGEHGLASVRGFPSVAQ